MSGATGVRIRGIYATALTARLENVVQSSQAIRERIDGSPSDEPAGALVETTSDRQGVGIHGEPESVAKIAATIEEVGRDTFRWSATAPIDGVFAGEVTETLGSGALVDIGTATGFLPFSATERRIETGDRLRVHVGEPVPPWSEDHPVLDTEVRLHGGLLDLVRGGPKDTGEPALVDLLPATPPNGWRPDWGPGALERNHEDLAAALETIATDAEALDAALEDAIAPTDRDPGPYWTGRSTTWCWFGRESRFALDEDRRTVTTTMPGHHRLKTAAEAASPAVDFVEAVCPEFNGEFPFDVATREFGPREGDQVAIAHGKPDGHQFDLGTGEVVDREPEGTVTIRREMTPGGTYDALDVERQAGDIALTTATEGRWWYPTIYRSEDGDRRGTYVNVCTPVEIFPDAVRYVDLYVDVVKHADGTVKRVDDDELDDAVAVGELSDDLADRAREVASAVESAL
ncbi:MAG: DUF402 domain-containing protein [Salinirussus sp.]